VHWTVLPLSGASSHSGAWETILESCITTSFRMRRDPDAEVVENKETWEGCHLTIPLGVWESVASGFYTHLRSERSHQEYLYQYIWAMASSKHRGARENFPASPHQASLDGPDHCLISVKVKSLLKVKKAIDENSSLSYGASPAIFDHTVLPATRHKWIWPALTPASQLVVDLPTREG